MKKKRVILCRKEYSCGGKSHLVEEREAFWRKELFYGGVSSLVEGGVVLVLKEEEYIWRAYQSKGLNGWAQEPSFPVRMGG